MANELKRTRTLTLTDETFTALKTLALIKKTSVSAIVENLGRQYIKDNTADLQRYFQNQISLFELDTDSSKN